MRAEALDRVIRCLSRRDEERPVRRLREGQLAFFVAIDTIARSVDADVTEFRRDREQFVRALRDATRQVRAEA